jgi:hypothetical protein
VGHSRPVTGQRYHLLYYLRFVLKKSSGRILCMKVDEFNEIVWYRVVSCGIV